MSLEELGLCTPRMFQALCHRRNIRIKYERFANAQTAAAVYNTARTSEDQPVVTAFDFVRDEEQSARRERNLQARRFIRSVVMSTPMNAGRNKFLEARANAIKKLKEGGFAEAEQVFNEMFPNLIPTEEEVNV